MNACKEAFIQRYAFTPNKLKLRDDGKYRSVEMRAAWVDHQRTWKAAQKAAQATIDSLRAELNAPNDQADSPCVEADGCPTEGAVLKRFWREHQS